jgi:hypothetical protein
MAVKQIFIPEFTHKRAGKIVLDYCKKKAAVYS